MKDEGHSGTHSLKVEITSYQTGDSKWHFAPLAVTPGETYRFSDWYRSNIPSHVVIDFTQTDGSHLYQELRLPATAADWTPYSETFEVPPQARAMTIYHLINEVGWLSTDDFTLTRVDAQQLDRPLVTITFDDGWEDNTVTALPILEQAGFRSTYYFATTYLENSPLTGPVTQSGPTAVRAIFAQGHEIGAHSVTHPDLTTVSPEDLTYEVSHSKQYLGSLVGLGNVTSFATPYGAYNQAVLAALQPLYASHRPTDEGFNTLLNYDPYRLKVQNMLQTTSLDQFKGWVDQAVANHSWLVLVYHRVASDNLATYDTPLDQFEAQMEYLKNSDVTVLPMGSALHEVSGQM